MRKKAKKKGKGNMGWGEPSPVKGVRQELGSRCTCSLGGILDMILSRFFLCGVLPMQRCTYASYLNGGQSRWPREGPGDKQQQVTVGGVSQSLCR